MDTESFPLVGLEPQPFYMSRVGGRLRHIVGLEESGSGLVSAGSVVAGLRHIVELV